MPVRSTIERRPRNGSPSVSSNMWEMERRYSVPVQDNSMSHQTGTKQRRSRVSQPHPPSEMLPNSAPPSASEDLHAWSIYRQNLNSDFTDSALGSSEKSPLPYGNFQLRESTVQSIISHPRYGPKTPLGSNMYTYLKFGLPRVFPPNGKRDGSSGYDSSEDGGPPSRIQDKKLQSYYHRTRSDPDFRNGPYQGTSSRHSTTTNMRGKSISEANLLSNEAMNRNTRMPPASYRRSVHDLRAVSELAHPQYIHCPPSSHLGNGRSAMLSGRSMSQPMLDMNVVGRSSHSAMERTAPSILSAPMSNLDSMPMSFQVSQSGNVYCGHHPHLQIRGLDVEGRKHERALQSITFEVKGGELLTVMATTAKDGKTLLDALAGQIRSRVQHVILNGQNITMKGLKERLVYVRKDITLSIYMNVAQTLTFHSHLRQHAKSSTGKTSVSHQMSLLIEELGLSQVMRTSVAQLTVSEIQRLKIACYLLSDADILLLDQPTAGMDIFDTFFMVEFLRQWANGGTCGITGKIVILTLQPPTYEIFTMASQVALISNGRMMFYGRRRDMLPYFASIDYPCPAYKNPSDYYSDLVTLDELSAEAMLESSQRIEQLGEIFQHRQEPLSDPGPPQPLPSKSKGVSFIFQIVAILLRHLVYCQPRTFLRWTVHALFAMALSLFIGAVFWDVPASDPQLVLNDRIGYHYAMMNVASLPILLLTSFSQIHSKDRAAVESDINDQLYGTTVYIVVTLICELPARLLIWTGYLVPSYAMSYLYQQVEDYDAFYNYLGFMLVYMMAIHSVLTMIGYLLPNRIACTILSTLLIHLIGLTSGIVLHNRDMNMFKQSLASLFPSKWILPFIIRPEYSSDTLAGHASHLVCRNKQIQHQDIIVQLPCPTPNGTAALNYNGLLNTPIISYSNLIRQLGPIGFTLLYSLIPIIITIIAFICIRRKYNNNNNQLRK